MLDYFGVDFLGFVLAHATQLAEGEAFFKEQRHAGKGTRGKGHQPKNHGRGDRRFLLHSIQSRERNDGERLGAAADTGQLHGRTDQSENQNENGVIEVERAEPSAETFDDQVIAKEHKKPMDEGEDQGGGEVAPSAHGLNPARKTEKDARNAGAPAVRRKPSFHATLEHSGAVKAKINEAGNRGDGEDRESSAGGASTLFKGRASTPSFEMVGGFKNKEANCREDSGASGVENALEGVDTKSVREGNVVFAGDEQWTDGLSSPSEKKESAEAGEVHRVDVPEARAANVSLELLPAKSADSVTDINGQDRKKEVKIVGAANGVPELNAAKLTEVENSTRTIEQEGDDERT